MDRKFRRVSRLRLVDDVRRSLEESILSGQMRPGERLAETWLAEQFSVSRTTVREALLMLQRQGHVVSTPRHGTYVRRLSPEEAADLCNVRALLESYAVHAGWPNVGPSLFARLETHLAEMAACRLPSDLPRLIQIDLAFHHLLVGLANSPHLDEAFSTLDAQIGALFLRSLECRGLAIDDIVAAHRRLLDALRSGDAALARGAVIAHYLISDGSAPRSRALSEILKTMSGLPDGSAARSEVSA